MTLPAPLRVLTDTDLFQRITSFQYGMPHSLYAFWLEHKPPRDLFLIGFLRNTGVVEKIVERGTLELLVQAKQARVPYENKWYQLSLVEVVPLAIQHNRPEMLEWGFQNRTWIPPRFRQHSTHHRPDSLWRYGVVYFDDGDIRVLDLLKRYVPIEPRSLQTLFSWDFTMEMVKSVELMRWLLTELPQARVERHLMSVAVSRGNADQVRFLYEHGSRNRCNPNYFRTLYDSRNLVLLTFLVERDLIDVDPYVAIQMVESDEEGVQQFVQRFPSHFVRAFEDVVSRYRYQPDKFRALLDRGYDNATFKVSIDEFTTHGELEIIKMLHERGYATASTDAMDHAAKNRHWAVVDYLHDHSLGGCSAAATDSAALWGDLEHVKFFHEKYGAGCTSRAMDDAAANGHLDVVRYLHDHTTAGCTSRAMDEAAANGHLDVVRYLHDHTTAECTTRAMDEAAANGRLDIVEYLHSHRSEGCTVAAMNRAAENGHIRVVQFLHAHRSEGCTVAAMNLAAGNGDIRMVKFLHSHRSEGCTKQAMNLAARYGHTNMVEFLHTHRSEGCSVAMDSAAENGHLRVVEFLHTHRSEGCSKRAMDKAAENGHLNVVQFLHTHRSEGCTVAAMNGAAKNDHLAVVEYLHTQRSEGCTAEAVNLHASTDTFCSGATIKFLYTHYPQFFGPTNLHDVLLYEHFDVFMQMRTQYPEQAEAVLGKVAFDAGTRFRLPPIRFIVNQLGGANVAHLAMDGAVSTGRLPWIRAVFAVTGPTSCRLSAVHKMRAAVKRQESSATNPAIVFVVNACCEAGAREAMIDGDPAHSDTTKLLRGDTPQLLPLHPFLTDPRAATWAINWVLSAPSWRRWQSAHQRFAGDWSWALMAVDNGDMSMLEMLRDTPASARPGHDIEGRELDPAVVDRQFSFERARTAAACRGNLPMLQWLIEHVDLPIEPTLLSAALYCHKYETALWLATHYPEACREIDWNIPYAPWFGPCGLEDELLEWLGAHEAVRAQLNLGPIVDVAVSRGDTKSLRTLDAWNPDVVKTRPSFMELASDPDDDMAMFLRELGAIDHA